MIDSYLITENILIRKEVVEIKSKAKVERAGLNKYKVLIIFLRGVCVSCCSVVYFIYVFCYIDITKRIKK